MTDYQKTQLITDTTQHKLFTKGIVTVNGNSETIPHNLGYAPVFRIAAEQISGRVAPVVVVAVFTNYHGDYFTSPDVTAYIDSTNLVIENSINGPVTVHYRIYYDS